MFSWFKKKEKLPEVRDVVFATKQGKWNALSELARQGSPVVFVAWFEESREKLQQYFDMRNVGTTVISYREIRSASADKIVFIEHYPLAEKEKTLFASLHNRNIAVYSSLDEAFFLHFGGDKISSLLTKMGLEENEAISNPMITRSISNAQEKLASKVTLDQSAHSMQEWMQKNLGTHLT